MRGASIRAGGGEDDASLFVGLADGIVFDFGLFPGRADRGIRADAELRDEIRDGAEDDGVVIEMVLDEIVEAVGAERRPGASDGDGEVAARGDEFDDVSVGSLVFKKCRVKKGAIIGSGCVAVPAVAGFFVAVVPLCELDFGAAAGAGVCAGVANPSDALTATAATAAIARPYFVNLESWTVVFEVLFVIRFLSVRFGSKLFSWVLLLAA